MSHIHYPCTSCSCSLFTSCSCSLPVSVHCSLPVPVHFSLPVPVHFLFLVTVHFLFLFLVTVHCSLFTSCSLFTVHCSLFTVHFLFLVTVHCSLPVPVHFLFLFNSTTQLVYVRSQVLFKLSNKVTFTISLFSVINMPDVGNVRKVGNHELICKCSPNNPSVYDREKRHAKSPLQQMLLFPDKNIVSSQSDRTLYVGYFIILHKTI